MAHRRYRFRDCVFRGCSSRTFRFQRYDMRRCCALHRWPVLLRLVHALERNDGLQVLGLDHEGGLGVQCGQQGGSMGGERSSSDRRWRLRRGGPELLPGRWRSMVWKRSAKRTRRTWLSPFIRAVLNTLVYVREHFAFFLSFFLSLHPIGLRCAYVNSIADLKCTTLSELEQ